MKWNTKIVLILILHSLTLRLVTTRGSAAQWKLALRYALPTGRTTLAPRGDPELMKRL